MLAATVSRAEQWPNEVQCLSSAGNSQRSEIQQGWCLAIDHNKGNCIACHTFNITPWPEGLPTAGNIAPPLVAMLPRFPDKAVLRDTIENATLSNPNTVMPPYLKHGILNQREVDLIIKFLESI